MSESEPIPSSSGTEQEPNELQMRQRELLEAMPSEGRAVMLTLAKERLNILDDEIFELEARRRAIEFDISISPSERLRRDDYLRGRIDRAAQEALETMALVVEIEEL